MDKCSGLNCMVKTNCDRFSLTESNVLQPPFTITNGIFKCTAYLGDHQSSISHKLEILVGKRNPDAYCDDYCRKSAYCDRGECLL